MKTKDFIKLLQELDGDIEIYVGLYNDEYANPDIEPTEDNDTGEYYYRIVGK